MSWNDLCERRSGLFNFDRCERRGAFKRNYKPGTLRKKLFGSGAGLGGDHPAAGYRKFQEERRLDALLNTQQH